MIVCISCIHLFTFLVRKQVDADHQKYPDINASDTSLYILGTLTNHCNLLYNFVFKKIYIGGLFKFHNITGVRSNPSPRSVGIVAFSWLLATFVFVNIYSSCMSSYMSLTFQRPDFSTYQDLADNPKQEPCILKGSSGYFLFMVILLVNFGFLLLFFIHFKN